MEKIKICRGWFRLVFALLLLCGVTTFVSAVTFPLTVNVNAEVTFKGTKTETITVSANTSKSVDLTWLAATADVAVSVKSLNTKYNDTTFTTKIEANTVKYPAWDKSKTYASKDTVSHNSKNWTAGWETSVGQEPGTTGEWGVWKEVTAAKAYSLDIILSAKPKSPDSAYIPIRANVAVKVMATPISLISGNVPTQPYEYQLGAKVTDTIVVPVRIGSTGIEGTRNNTHGSVTLSKYGTTNLVTLPASYQKGTLAVFASSGRKIGSLELAANAQHDLSVWDVAPGIYLLHVRDMSGTVSVKKLQHNGGDLKIAISFSTQFSVGGLVNARTVSTATRAETAQYRFAITPVDSKFGDTTHTVSLTGQLNALQNYFLVDPANPTGNLEALLDSATYEKLFPNRYGKGYGAYINDPLPAKPTKLASDGDYDFFTHASLIKAADSISRIEVQVYQREGHPYMHRLVWKDKKTGQTRTMINNVAYNNYTNKEFLAGTVDFANFCNEGEMATRKQELAAFLGNISHETTGGGNEEKKKTWGLYWREEVAWQNGSTGTGYRDEAHATYKPTSGKSYHGRGPIQISWNYNYGQVSEFLYGDKQILLDNPEKVCPPKPQDATLSFMTAIWFWMTPQAPKPSCHDVMVGNWVPTAADKAANRDKSKFGMTVNIINGGLECGIPTDHRVEDRIGFYKRYIGLMGETPETKCDCADMGKM